MTGLFAQVYIDEDVSILLATLLQSRGFKATTTLGAGNVGITDAQQLEYACNISSAILTHNRSDFEQLADRYFSLGKTHSEIIIAVRRMPHDILNRILKLLNETSADELANNVWYV